jgi:hypothetical protein
MGHFANSSAMIATPSGQYHYIRLIKERLHARLVGVVNSQCETSRKYDTSVIHFIGTSKGPRKRSKGLSTHDNARHASPKGSIRGSVWGIGVYRKGTTFPSPLRAKFALHTPLYFASAPFSIWRTSYASIPTCPVANDRGSRTAGIKV